MKTDESKKNRPSNILPQVFGASVAGIGLVALLGWILGFPFLASFGEDLIPMAPSTALLFVLFGVVLFFRNRSPQSRGMYMTGIAVGSIGAIMALLLFYFSSAGIYSHIELFGFSIEGRVGGVPIGHMSPLTAVCFVVAAFSFLTTLASSAGRPRRATVALVLACVVVVTSLVLMLAYFFGNPLLYGGVFIPPALPTSLAFLLLALGLIVTAGPQVWPFSRIKESATSGVSYVLALVFVLLTSGIVAIGYFYYSHYEREYRMEIERQLSAVAELKTDEIMQWRKERLGDAAGIYKNVSFSELVRRYLERPADAQKRLRAWMKQIREAYQYDRLCLYDTDIVKRLSYPKEIVPTDSIFLHRASEVLRTRQIAFQDFYRDEQNGRVYLNMLIPILDDHNPHRVIGILAMRIDPQQYLYPLINRWPIPSRSAETLIIRREENDALYLNELRFQKNAALTLRIPLSQRDVAAVRAARGEEGIIESIDYRGVPVIAYVRAVPNSPWFLVARVDISEVFSPLQERLWMMIIFTCALIIGAGASVGLVWRHQRARFYREKFQASETLRGSEEKYRRLVELLPDGVVVHSEGRIIYANSSSAKIVGAESPAKLIGTPVIDFVHPDYREIVFKRIKQSLSEGGIAPVMEEQFIRIDGTSFTAEVSAVPISFGDKLAMLTVFNDITERKRAEEALKVSEGRFKTVSKLSSDFSYSCIHSGENGYWVDWITDAFYSITGYDEKELREKKCWLFTAHPDDRSTIVDQFNSLHEGESLEQEFRLVTKDGRVQWINNKIECTSDPSIDGKRKVFGSVQNVTERKRAEEVLRYSEERFRAIAFNTPDHILMQDRDLRYNFVINPQLGLTEADMVGKTDRDILGKEDGENLTAIKRKVLETGEPFHLEVSLKNLKGKPEFFDGFYVPKFDSTGKVDGLIGYFRNITERKLAELASKRAEEALRENEERFRKLFERHTAVMLVLDVEMGTIIDANEAAVQFYGWSIEELKQMRIQQINTLLPEAVKAEMENAASSKCSKFEFRHRRADGSIRDVEVFSNKIEIAGKGILYSIIHDITERKRAAEELRNREGVLQKIFDVLPVGLWFADKDGKLLRGNPAGVKIWGAEPKVSPSEYGVFKARRLPSGEEVAPDDWALAHTIRDKVTIVDELLEIDTFDGKKRTILNYTAPVLDAQGDVQGAIVVNQDITERKQAEIQIQFQANLLTNVSDAILATDRQFNIQYWNTGAEKQYGWTSAEVLGRHFMKVIQPQYIGDSRKTVMQKIVQEGFWAGELLHNRRDGTLFPVHVTISEVRNAEGQIIGHVAINRDITERKRAEKKVKDAHEELTRLNKHLNRVREEERTRVSREIHDELGQGLTTVKIDLSLLESKLRPDQTDLVRRCQSMQALVDCTITTVQRISSQLRPGLLDDLGLGAAIEWQTQEFEKRTEIECSTNIAPVTDMLSGEKRVEMFRMFQEALTNVARHSKATRLDVRLSAKGDSLLLELKDNGVGIDPGRINARNALGLVGMRERAKSVGGSVSISGSPGSGTCVRIEVPLAEKYPSDAPENSKKDDV